MADSESRAGERYADAATLEYLNRVHHPHDAGLERAFSAAEDDERIPAIQLAPAEGRFLEFLLRLVGAETVVEVGTLAGFSALCMARALPPSGRVYTLESDPHHAAVARANIERAGFASRVEVIEGDAMERLPELEALGPFCAVFIDADKARYDRYARWARANLRSGGLLIGDNAYFFGNLLAPEDAAAAAMRRFHEELAAHFESVCLPTPDGMALGVKP